MTALALCVHDLGIEVKGSDLAEHFVTDPVLAKAGIGWKLGFKPENLGEPDLVIYTAAHQGRDNLEVKTALKRDIPVLSHAQALGLLMKDKRGIAVAGVGGKTTTSSMIATVFAQTGSKPAYAIGVGWLKPLGFPGHYNRRAGFFIAEADEYFASPQDETPRFLYLNPEIIVLTNIEFDHPDVYQNLNQTLQAFQAFVEKLPAKGLLVANIDNPQIKKLIQMTKVKTITYGFDQEADYQLSLTNQRKGQNNFLLQHQSQKYQLALRIPGRFNLLNAAAAFIVARHGGVKPEEIKKGLLAFKGTKRRFEFIKKIKGISLYDDYAHHPLEIKATLKAAKNWFPKKRLIAVFQPHTYSRTKSLLADFAQAFSKADLVVITDIYASAREKPDPAVSGQVLAAEIKKHQPAVCYQPGEKEVARFLKEEARIGDVLFTLGAGDIFNWHDSILKVIVGNPGVAPAC